MDLERKSLRMGALVIACAVILRLFSIGFFDPLAGIFQSPAAAAAFLYLETGRLVRYDAVDATRSWEAESPPPELPPSPTHQSVHFAPADLELVRIRYSTSYRPELEELLLSKLEWDLKSGEPTVLILHTHATESYTKPLGASYEESGDYRTADTGYNMVSIGDALAELLEEGGITVLHDRTLHDLPSYNGAYDASRSAVRAYLEQYPSIKLILDLHRDAASSAGSQLSTTTTLGGQKTARLMLVMGTGEGGLNYPNWQENLSLALKLQVLLEQQMPGICRDLSLRSQRFNQDLHPGTLLVEVGAAGDTREAALAAIKPLAEAILALAGGTE